MCSGEAGGGGEGAEERQDKGSSHLLQRRPGQQYLPPIPLGEICKESISGMAGALWRGAPCWAGQSILKISELG